ncbi:MAG: sensor domain-containing diguanylate cyclase [bacterium]|nr:sensor domain-containing diguanylate cyclase [bacterium]
MTDTILTLPPVYENTNTPEEEISFLEKRVQDLEKEQDRLKEVEEQNNKLKILIDINTYIISSLQKEEILKRILNRVKKLLKCDSSSLLLVDEEINRLKFAFVSQKEEEQVLKFTSLRKGEGVAGTVWANGVPIIINNPQNDPRFTDKVDRRANTRTNSLMAAPLTVDGKVIGVVEAINRTEGYFSQFDLQILQYIATQSAIAIHNADLYDMAIKDGMTKLFIHKHFKEKLYEEWNRAKRLSHTLSLLMLDIDHFKSFNDTHGHQAGDAILKEVARIIRENCRSIDIPCRYGGEEFAIILPGTSKKEAIIAAERIRKIIEALEMKYENSSLHITISAGIATIPELAPKGAEELITMADRALYSSKESGRNRTTFYDSADIRLSLS